MGKLKLLFLPIFVSLFLIPLSISFAQEDEIMLYGTEEDDSVIYESGPVEEESPVLYDTEYTYDFGTTDIEQRAARDVTIVLILVSTVIFLSAYIFSAVALVKIGKEMNYQNTWFAWVPVLQSVMLFQLVDMNPLLLLLLLIPGLGQAAAGVLMIIALMKLTEKRGYDKTLALILLLTGLGSFILLYLLAWKPKTVSAQIPEAQQPTPVDPNAPTIS